MTGDGCASYDYINIAYLAFMLAIEQHAARETAERWYAAICLLLRASSDFGSGLAASPRQ